MLLVLLGFAGCSFLIFYSGKRLSYYGDIIAFKSGLGRIWIGLILLATVTSLPELVVNISSVTVVNSADLAVGNILGSCTFNLAILSVLDALSPGQPILTRVARSNVLAVAMGSILLSLVGVGLFIPNEIVILDWIGLTSVAFVIIYLFSIRLLYSYGKVEIQADSQSKGPRGSELSIGSAGIRYGAHALVVILAAIFLPYLAQRIVAYTGWSESFVSTLFLAASSSLPEIAIAVSAARMGASDMAVANLFGSNLFNVLLLSVTDLFYLNGNLLKDGSDSHIMTVFAILIMNSVAILGLIVRPEKKPFRFLAWDTAVIFIIYLFNLIFLFLNQT